MALPPEEPPLVGPSAEQAAPPARAELRLIEARDAKERRCADCGKRTEQWRPVRRKGTTVIVCLECAAKPPPEAASDGCPKCGAPLGPEDEFCGRCGQRLEYACPTCGDVVAPADAFCGKCGGRLA